MSSSIFIERTTITRLRASAIGAYAESFASGLVERGYQRSTVRVYVLAAGHLGRWTHARGVDLAEIDQQVIDSFDRHLRVCRCREPNRGKRSNASRLVLTGARHFLEYLRGEGIARPRIAQAPRPLVADFVAWMKQRRGTADSTLRLYSHFVRAFLDSVGDDVSAINVGALRRFVLQAGNRPAGGPYAQNSTKSLRSFVGFLVASGRCPSNLEDALPRVAHWRLASLPNICPIQTSSA